MEWWGFVLWCLYLIGWWWWQGWDESREVMIVLVVYGMSLGCGWELVYFLAVAYDRLSVAIRVATNPTPYESRHPEVVWATMLVIAAAQMLLYRLIW